MYEVPSSCLLIALFVITNGVAAAAQPAVPIAITPFDARSGLPMSVTAPVNASHDWNGWYAGGRVASTRGTASAILSSPDPIRSSRAFDRLDGGLHLGFNAVLA